MMKTAIIVAWRTGENELAATVDSARASIGDDAEIRTVEDVNCSGPGRTRHRGIEAAQDADVIIIIDPHMRFDGDVLRQMARSVAKSGGLLCPMCYHNPDCSFDRPSYYAGADIHIRSRFASGEQYALCWKWTKDMLPGPRACVGGACYAFRRDWYYEVGQPLSCLPGWGCDEEALSIAAWMSGTGPEVVDGRVAHRWRSQAPWHLSEREKRAIWSSRMSLIHAVVTEPEAKKALIEWQLAWIPQADKRFAVASPEAERFRLALLRQPRTWEQWRNEVCKGDSIEEPMKTKKHKSTVAVPIAAPEITPRTSTANVKPRANYGANEDRRICPKCGSNASRIERTVQTVGKVIRYRVCCDCGAHRATQDILKSDRCN